MSDTHEPPKGSAIVQLRDTATCLKGLVPGGFGIQL